MKIRDWYILEESKCNQEDLNRIIYLEFRRYLSGLKMRLYGLISLIFEKKFFRHKAGYCLFDEEIKKFYQDKKSNMEAK